MCMVVFVLIRGIWGQGMQVKAVRMMSVLSQAPSKCIL